MRGCERKIILLKGTESQMFDEAYFLVRKDFETRRSEEIMREAQRVIDRNTTRSRNSKLLYTALFLLGFLLGSAMSILLFSIAI
ncbi:MAG: hypothetical protein IIX18_03800 [Clostridia bacterium]|nr:hypothetical protein [Clostridia bacterium]MBQ6614425.1 hypothetical protein [Clostridia bacterium]